MTHPARMVDVYQVLPVIASDLGYDDLEIADGHLASLSYMRAFTSPDIEQRTHTFDSLRAYCARDTLAMVELRRSLAKLANSENSSVAECVSTGN